MYSVLFLAYVLLYSVTKSWNRISMFSSYCAAQKNGIWMDKINAISSHVESSFCVNKSGNFIISILVVDLLTLNGKKKQLFTVYTTDTAHTTQSNAWEFPSQFHFFQYDNFSKQAMPVPPSLEVGLYRNRTGPIVILRLPVMLFVKWPNQRAEE